MDIMLKFICIECKKSFIVNDTELENEQLGCSHCGADVQVPDDDQDD